MKHQTTVALTLAVLVMPWLASASTWHVEKDGAGDFTVIQEAVDAASDGDTIKIGPGRFEDFFEQQSFDVWNIALIEGKSLTFLGAGVENTILGPEEIGIIDSHFVNCIRTFGDGIVVRVSDIRFENVQADGIRMSEPGRIEVDDCEFENCGGGLWGSFRDGGWIRNCAFYDIDQELGDRCIELYAPTVGVVVEDCLFRDSGTGVSSDWAGTHDNVIRRCDFEGGQNGVRVIAGASVTVENSSFSGQSRRSILGDDPGTVIIEGNHIDTTGSGGWCLLTFNGSGEYIIRDNTMSSDGIIIGMYTSRMEIECHGNHFIRTGADAWYIHPGGAGPEHHPGDLRILDFTDNHWGTNDPDEVAAWIFDHDDDPDYHYSIDFQPMADPVAVESHSWSGVKAIFSD